MRYASLAIISFILCPNSAAKLRIIIHPTKYLFIMPWKKTYYRLSISRRAGLDELPTFCGAAEAELELEAPGMAATAEDGGRDAAAAC